MPTLGLRRNDGAPRIRAEQDAQCRRRDARPNTKAGLGLLVMCRAERGRYTPSRGHARALTALRAAIGNAVDGVHRIAVVAKHSFPAHRPRPLVHADKRKRERTAVPDVSTGEGRTYRLRISGARATRRVESQSQRGAQLGHRRRSRVARTGDLGRPARRRSWLAPFVERLSITVARARLPIVRRGRLGGLRLGH